MKTFFILIGLFVGVFLVSCTTEQERLSVITSLKSQAIQSANTQVTIPDDISSYPALEEEILEFTFKLRRDYGRLLSNAYDQGEDVSAWLLDVDVEVMRNDDLYLSVSGQTYMYTGGGSNGIVAFETWNYHKPTQTLVGIDDILIDETTSLKKISDLVLIELRSRNLADDTWIQNGASPDLQNFSVWNVLDTGGIRFAFDPYQVADYDNGIVYVTLDFDSIRDSIKVEYLQTSPGNQTQ